MVAPDARRRGIGSALLDAAVPLCRERGDRQPLLVVPRQSIAGKRLALSRGGTLDHSEHHLVLSGEPTSGPHKPQISLRPATVADVPLVVSLLEQGFGWSGPDDLGDRLERTALIELRGAVVGTLFLERDDDEEASIFGFVVAPSWRGRGIGRAALRQACEQLRAGGARRISPGRRCRERPCAGHCHHVDRLHARHHRGLLRAAVELNPTGSRRGDCFVVERPVASNFAAPAIKGFRIGLADSDSGSAAIRPVSATMQKPTQPRPQQALGGRIDRIEEGHWREPGSGLVSRRRGPCQGPGGVPLWIGSWGSDAGLASGWRGWATAGLPRLTTRRPSGAGTPRALPTRSPRCGRGSTRSSRT